MRIEKGEGLKKGGKAGKERIKALQEELKKAGYWDGPLDGEFSDELDTAVRRFQKDRHLAPDGEAGVETGIALNAFVDGVAAAAKKGDDEQDPGKETAALEKANREMKRAAISRLEKRMTDAPWPHGPLTEAEREATEELLYTWRKRLIEELGQGKEGDTPAAPGPGQGPTPKGGPKGGKKEGGEDGGAVPPDPEPPGDDRESREAFARAIRNEFVAWAKTHDCCDLDACTLAAQWMMESKWGRSELSKEGKNLGGIKGKGPAGSLEKSTKEQSGTGKKTIKADFAKYNNFTEFFAAYCDLICKKDRYANARGKKGKEYFQALKDAGYATDAEYVEKAMKVYAQVCPGE